eukprot:9492498-Pyramimonas_sp.AAC.1
MRWRCKATKAIHIDHNWPSPSWAQERCACFLGPPGKPRAARAKPRARPCPSRTWKTNQKRQ